MSKKENRKIVVGMSGGVDSSVALILLKKQGWDPIGVSLKYTVWNDKENNLRENVCCSTASFDIAKQVCEKLNVPHHIVDVAEEFKKEVIDYFTTELKNKRTPNPCIICNPNLKFNQLFKFAKSNNIKYVATGHYARLRREFSIFLPAAEPALQAGNFQFPKYLLKKARDKSKDQTYSLSFLPQEYLKHIIFPLGNYTKKRIYKIAQKEGFDFFSAKGGSAFGGQKIKQSQDFCFVANKSMPKFLSKEIGECLGEIQDKDGNKLGEHKGLHFYTIGQRKGISIANGPWFVTGFNIKNNILIISKNKSDLYQSETLLENTHFIQHHFFDAQNSGAGFISGKSPTDTIKIKAKIRYQHKPAKAKLIPMEKNSFKLIFKKPQKSVTPGQFAVFYKGKVCLGGGVIVG